MKNLNRQRKMLSNKKREKKNKINPGVYKVASPPGVGIETSCWGRKSSGEEGKGKGKWKIREQEGKGEGKGNMGKMEIKSSQWQLYTPLDKI